MSMNNGKYQLFDALDPATEAALRTSIATWGVIVPVVVDQHGNILDGHHRSRIAQQLGVEYSSTVMFVEGEEQAGDIARTLNTDRRHLTVEQRRVVVTHLRSQGFSTRAIAGAVGASQPTVLRDLSTDTHVSVEPKRVVGVNGKTYAPTQPARVAQAAAGLQGLEPEREQGDLLAEASAIADIAADIDEGVTQAVDSRRIPKPVPKKRIADGIPPHPATYPAAVLAAFRELLDGETVNGIVLDPFGGVGGIHQLTGYTCLSIEIEAEWAAAHPLTIHGDARNAKQLLKEHGNQVLGRQGARRKAPAVGCVATSPAYGNRLADDYKASDPEARHSYAIDLGHPLTEGNGGGLHFGTDGAYEQLHREVWTAVSELLEPDGLFLLNCKDFQRNGKIMPVTGWHIGVLAELGLVCEDMRILPAAGLPFTTAKPLSEVVLAFRKARTTWH